MFKEPGMPREDKPSFHKSDMFLERSPTDGTVGSSSYRDGYLSSPNQFDLSQQSGGIFSN